VSVSLVPPGGPEVTRGEPTFGTVDGSIQEVAVAMLTAVADGSEEDAGNLANALAERGKNDA
jgi:hypothetical protein